ncbi:hypothetical protein BGZ76_000994 [Entomortierella beljakovae]|nr:hypothetical protein BGZ76_000994 [Entomortierella beljakovae]
MRENIPTSFYDAVKVIDYYDPQSDSMLLIEKTTMHLRHQQFISKENQSTRTADTNTTLYKSSPLEQGLEKRSIWLTKEERKVLLANEIPASEIKNLSRGADSGGMGTIHFAEWKGIKVAIKEASSNVISKEVEIYNLMKGYAGIVQFYGVTYPPGLDTLCIVMKFADNGSLSWYLKESFHKLTWANKIKLATQITSSIMNLHQKGIFHRDLHGGNILIDEVGNAMLTDFGASTVDDRVAKNIDDYAITSTTTSDGTSRFISQLIPSINTSLSGYNTKHEIVEEEKHPLIGVMAYIAPERFRNPRYFDTRCDIYSLGVLLWELTSGHAAFARAPQDVQLAISILNGKREAPIEGTPVAYRELYERCWESDPEMRPSLDEILLSLTRIRESLSVNQLSATRERSRYNKDDGKHIKEWLLQETKKTQ